MNRRDFLARACAGCAVLALGGPADSALAAPPVPDVHGDGVREAMWYQSAGNGRALCTLCPCSPLRPTCGMLEEGEMCACRVRFNRGGKLYTTTYARPSTLSVDPIEKNPIYHMMPGLRTMAIATAGCNMACKNCQNWQLSQARVDEVRSFRVTPKEAVDKAVAAGCRGITFTYTEPVVFYEYMLDVAKLAHRRGLRTAMVTGGYINPDPLRALVPHIDMFSVSIKAFTEEIYRTYMAGRLDTIQNALRTLKAARAWFEVVVLPIPTVSDNPAQINDFCRWIARDLGTAVPVHFLRFVPEYRLRHLPPTPVALLDEARAIARRAGIKYAYVGNLPGHEGANTLCPHCRRTLVVRVGMRVLRNDVRSGRCGGCGTRIPGVWS